jgi:enamine deaminase RidA (YjgF/YER057c/UK114 family)
MLRRNHLQLFKHCGAIFALMLVVMTTGACGTGSPSTENMSPATEAQYRQALENARDCFQSAGFEADEVQKIDDSVRWSFAYDSSEGVDEAAAERTYDACMRQAGVAAIARSYWLSQVPTGAEREKMFEQLWDCLDSVGVNTTGLSSASQVEDIVRRAVELPDNDAAGLVCMDKYELLFPERAPVE